jgi:hypothetical protein
MKGEKVDMNSIKNSVMEEMKGVGKKAQSFGSEASALVSEKAQTVGADVKNFTKRSRSGLGDVIAVLAKILAYTIVGMVCFGLVMALIGMGIVSIGLFPLKDYVLRSGWQNTFAWGTLLFFIAVPIVGIITWLIRRIAKTRANSKMLRLTFGSLWVLGWVCIIMLASLVSRDFRSSSRLEEQPVNLMNPKINKLIVSSSSPFEKKYYRRNWIRFEPFENVLNEDTAFVRNIEVAIAKSASDSFRVTMVKKSRGYKTSEANIQANRIEFNINQLDSLLVLEKGIAINKTDKFRNQGVLITVYVPVGKGIKIKKGIGWPVHFSGGGPWSDGDWDTDFYETDDNMNWQPDVDYMMHADGLYTLAGKKANGFDDRNNTKVKISNGTIEVQSDGKRTRVGPDGIRVTDENNDYRYNEFDKKADSVRRTEQSKKQRVLDSIKTEKEKLEKLQNKIENNENNEPGVISSSILPGLTIFPMID